MGKNIKIELDLPEFEKDLVISVTLHRDGEAITASTPDGVKTVLDSGSAWKQSADFWESPGPAPVKASSTTKKKASPKASGNMMDMNF